MKKFILTLGVGLLTASLLSACAPKESSIKKDTTHKQATTTLTIGTMSSPESIPLYVAQEKGYFKKQHLNVQLKNFKSPKDRDAAISAGQLDGSVADVVSLTTYVNGGLGWKIGSALNGSFGILTNQPNIKSIADLKGKSVATMPRQTPTFYLYQELAKHNMKQSDVKITEVAQVPARIQLCLDRKVDAIIVPDPFMAIAKSKGARVIAQSNPQSYQTTILGVAPKLAKNAAVRKRFFTAYNQAVTKVNASKATDFTTILTKDIGYPKAMVPNVKLIHYTKARAISKDTLHDAFDYALKEGMVKKAIKPSQVNLKVEAN